MICSGVMFCFRVPAPWRMAMLLATRPLSRVPRAVPELLDRTYPAIS